MAKLLEAGQRIQCFWLTSTKLGLAMQPALAILIFAHYGETAGSFTADPALQKKSKALAQAFHRVLGVGTDDFIFMGRIGQPRPKNDVCRSTRRSLPELLVDGQMVEKPSPDYPPGPCRQPASGGSFLDAPSPAG